MLRFVAALVFAFTAVACALSHDNLMKNLRDRAAFDMNCPSDKLVLTELTESGGGNVNTVGVRGCEQQAVYVRANDHTNWVLDAKKPAPK